jgi:hypothetical protein
VGRADGQSEETYLGVTLFFDARVSEQDRQLIRDGVRIAHTYFSEQLGVSVTRPVCFDVRSSAPDQNPAAQAYDHRLIIFSSHPVWTGTTTFQRTKIAIHEYFHVVQNELRWPIDPRWLIEGAAEYVAYQAIVSAGSISQNQADQALGLQTTGPNALSALRDMPPLSSLEPGSAWLEASANRQPVYSLAYLAVQVATANRGVGALRAYGQAVGSGTEWRPAFESAFGMTVAALYIAVDDYIRRYRS